MYSGGVVLVCRVMYADPLVYNNCFRLSQILKKSRTLLRQDNANQQSALIQTQNRNEFRYVQRFVRVKGHDHIQ